ncbi:MAG: hypothetical protein JW819_13920 [Candidatus Krumholzibacteriota bacterium]|nr:hypothetical protein [Candidatus Krumholzibacteriota bacterium]
MLAEIALSTEMHAGEGRRETRQPHEDGKGRRQRFASPLALVWGWILSVALTLLSGSAAAETEFFYRCVEGDDLRLAYYSEDHAYIIPHLARCFENSLRFHKRLFHYTPSEPVTVLLQDFDDFGYAGTTTIPYNYLTLGIEPFEQIYDTCPTNERLNWVMNHELVHVLACDQAAGRDRFFRRLFRGKVSATDSNPLSMLYSYLTSPRRYAPRWYHEGLAVFMETWMAGGIGRVLGGYDEMVFRTMVRDGSYFYEYVGLESEGTTQNFQIGQTAYLYGTRFVSYLAYHYGPEKVLRWAQRPSGSAPGYAAQFRRLYGRSLDDEWSRWIAWERGWQQANLDSIRQYPTTPYRVLSRQPLGSASRAFLDPERRRLYTAVRYPGEFAQIAAIDIDSGELSKVCEVTSPGLYYVASLAYDPDGDTLFFTTDNGGRWRDLNAVDLATGEVRCLIEDSRAGDLVFSRPDGALWGVQHHLGKARLVRFPPPYTAWQELLVLPYGKDLFDIDVSLDGQQITGTLAEVDGSQRLIRLDIAGLFLGLSAYDVLWEFKDNTAANFVHSADGRHLYGTSYYTGTSNVFRYDFESQEMACLSNCETGFFRPLPAPPDSLVVFRFTGDGLQPVMIPERAIDDVAPVRYLGQAIVEAHPVVKDWVLGSPREVVLDSTLMTAKRYSGLRSLRLAAAYPIVEGYGDYPAYGLHCDVMDPLWQHKLEVALSYTPHMSLPEEERLHASGSYRHHHWTLDAGYNAADFYDLFGPTKRSFKGTSLGLSYAGYLIDEQPRQLRYTLGLEGFDGLETVPGAQDVETAQDWYLQGMANLRYSDLHGTIGAIEAEKGLQLGLVAASTWSESDFLSCFGNLTWGVLLPWDHSSLWFRTALGQAFGERDDPFSNFYFGGFGNNWVDHGRINRYRQPFSFPGMAISSIAGRNFARGGLEWTLPPLRFRRLGVPALYCNWSRLALFTNLLLTDLDDGQVRQELVDWGAQLNFRVVLFSSLESTFSMGAAIAATEGERPSTELMISLKIL